MRKAFALRHLVLFVCLLVFSLSTARAQQYNFKRFSVEEGLSRSGVYCLLEDSRGYLWIGTEGGGLDRFDGQNFSSYTVSNGLADNTIRSLFEDRDGNIWIGTDGHGLSKFDGATFSTYTTDDGLSNNYVRCITQGPGGDIWIGTFGGGADRIHFENDSLVVEVFDRDGPLKDNNVRAALCAADGTLWFGTDAGLVSLKDGVWTGLTRKDGLSHDQVLTLYEDRLKNLWIGTQNGVNKMTDNGFVSYAKDDGLAQDRIRAICQDSQGLMWFGTQKGITRFDGDHFISFTEANGLSNDRVRHIISDRTGNLWFGTYFGGICRFSGEEFIHFTESDGISDNQVLSVYNHLDGDIWLGTLDGITELSANPDGTWNIYQNPLGSEFRDRSINTIVKGPDDQIWFGSDKGVFIKTGSKVSRLQTDGNTLQENVKSILFESTDAIWIGSDQGATRFIKTSKGFQFDQYHSNPNINESEVSTIIKDGFGRVWIGYLNAGLVIYDNEEFTTPDTPEKLRDVASILIGPNGILWVATEGSGLFKHRLTKNKISAIDFESIGPDQGLSSSDIHQLIFDSNGDLWIGTASGVDEIALNRRSEIVSVKHYGMSDGFMGTETNENALCLDRKGALWFGTIRGVTRYNAKAKRKDHVENLLHITGLNLEFETADWATYEHANGIEGYFRLPKDLCLPFALNNLTIEYSAINLRAPDQVQYQWKLEGFSDEWSLVEEKNYHSFTNLKPRTYVFQVRSTNSDGVWNVNPATFTFTIHPPIYMTWWFITISAIILVLLVFAIIKLRERKLLIDKQKLQAKVDERTIELRHEKERSDQLLLNILPAETAEELKKQGFASVRYYEKVSVLFTDFVGFTNITEDISHQQLVESLDEHFRLFDDIMEKYSIEKIKTIGDAYMAAGGIPVRSDSNPLSVVAAGLEMIHALEELNRKKELLGQKVWKLRLGIHTGSVISGVVGKNKFAFDIWGDAVNTAARMESSGDVMKVNVSGATYKFIKNHFVCTSRGKIKAKNKGEIEMYFVDGFKPQYRQDESGLTPNATFMKAIRAEREKIAILH